MIGSRNLETSRVEYSTMRRMRQSRSFSGIICEEARHGFAILDAIHSVLFLRPYISNSGLPELDASDHVQNSMSTFVAFSSPSPL